MADIESLSKLIITEILRIESITDIFAEPDYVALRVAVVDLGNLLEGMRVRTRPTKQRKRRKDLGTLKGKRTPLTA